MYINVLHSNKCDTIHYFDVHYNSYSMSYAANRLCTVANKNLQVVSSETAMKVRSNFLGPIAISSFCVEKNESENDFEIRVPKNTH